MKRIKIFKVYFILWLFVYFIAISNIETFKLYFLSTLTFNIAIVTILAIGTIMLLKGAKDVVMLAGTFGVLMYKKRNLPFYIRGIEKVLPSNIAQKISTRAENEMLLFTQQEKEEILSWMDEQFANQNKYNNFFIGTVLMIGLLGTFSGLLGAIGNMASIVMSLSGSNIDIGKIMSDFSGPLSSMAVGFGSSLFGVISAILLSIKGYLLNRAQASVLDGVENWLNGKTVDTLQIVPEEESRESTSVQHPSLLDLFAEKMGALQREIAVMNRDNRQLHEAYAQTVQMLTTMQRKQQETTTQIAAAMGRIAEALQREEAQIERVGNVLKKGQHESGSLLHELIRLEKDAARNMVDIRTELEDLAYLMQKSQSGQTEDTKIALFEVVDAIEGMQRQLRSEIRTLARQSASSDKKDEQKPQTVSGTAASFLEKHFARKRQTMQESQ